MGVDGVWIFVMRIRDFTCGVKVLSIAIATEIQKADLKTNVSIPPAPIPFPPSSFPGGPYFWPPLPPLMNSATYNILPNAFRK